MEQKGKVVLVGAGPGDPALLTLKGKEMIEKAQVIVYDKLVGQGILAMIPPGTRTIDVGKVAGSHPVPQYRINEILLEEAQKGNFVVRLKGGDPFLFGRGGEELELLSAHDIPFEVVCGVTSALSVPAYQGIPVTHRDMASSLHIITGHTKSAPEAEIDYPSLVKLKGTLVFLMGVSALPVICQKLVESGMDPETPAAVLERGTTARQRRIVATVSTLPQKAQEEKVQTPAIIVVGKVCSLAEKFHWAEDRPLGGVKVLVTRPRALASRLSGKLREKGAEVVELPSITTNPISPNENFAQMLAELSQVGMILMTSPTGVQVFFDLLKEHKKDIRSLAGISFGAIGSATCRELEQRGIYPEIVPEIYDGEHLAQAAAQQYQKGLVWIPRAEQGNPVLTEVLEKHQIPYRETAIYRTTGESSSVLDGKAMAKAGEFDYVAFTSASTVRGFVGDDPNWDGSGIKALCIGQQTAKQAKAYGMVTFVSSEATMDSMVELLEQLHRKEN